MYIQCVTLHFDRTTDQYAPTNMFLDGHPISIPHMGNTCRSKLKDYFQMKHRIDGFSTAYIYLHLAARNKKANTAFDLFKSGVEEYDMPIGNYSNPWRIKSTTRALKDCGLMSGKGFPTCTSITTLYFPSWKMETFFDV